MIGAARPRAPLNFLGQSPVKLPAGGTVQSQVLPASRPDVRNVQLALNDPPEGISVQKYPLPKKA